MKSLAYRYSYTLSIVPQAVISLRIPYPMRRFTHPKTYLLE